MSKRGDQQQTALPRLFTPQEEAMNNLYRLTGITFDPSAILLEEKKKKNSSSSSSKSTVSGDRDDPLDNMDTTWGTLSEAPRGGAGLQLSSRVAWVEMLNLESIGVAQCPLTKKIFACCPGANEHPTALGFFSSPWNPGRFVAPLERSELKAVVDATTGKKIAAAELIGEGFFSPSCQRRFNSNSAARGGKTTIDTERMGEPDLHAKLDLVVLGVQKQVSAYSNALVGADQRAIVLSGGTENGAVEDSFPFASGRLVSAFLGPHVSVVDADQDTSSGGVGSALAAGLQGGRAVNFNIYVVIQHQQPIKKRRTKQQQGGEGRTEEVEEEVLMNKWSSVHSIAVSNSHHGSRYLIGSQLAVRLHGASGGGGGKNVGGEITKENGSSPSLYSLSGKSVHIQSQKDEYKVLNERVTDMTTSVLAGSESIGNNLVKSSTMGGMGKSVMSGGGALSPSPSSAGEFIMSTEEDKFSFMHSVDEHVRTIVELIQQSEQHHLLPAILRVSLPRFASLLGGKVKQAENTDPATPGTGMRGKKTPKLIIASSIGKEPTSEKKAASSDGVNKKKSLVTAAGGSSRPREQTARMMMGCRSELRALVAKREAVLREQQQQAGDA